MSKPSDPTIVDTPFPPPILVSMADDRLSATNVYRRQSGGIFGNAENTVIYGGNFTNVVSKKKGSTQYEYRMCLY